MHQALVALLLLLMAAVVSAQCSVPEQNTTLGTLMVSGRSPENWQSIWDALTKDMEPPPCRERGLLRATERELWPRWCCQYCAGFPPNQCWPAYPACWGFNPNQCSRRMAEKEEGPYYQVRQLTANPECQEMEDREAYSLSRARFSRRNYNALLKAKMLCVEVVEIPDEPLAPETPAEPPLVDEEEISADDLRFALQYRVGGVGEWYNRASRLYDEHNQD